MRLKRAAVTPLVLSLATPTDPCLGVALDAAGRYAVTADGAAGFGLQRARLETSVSKNGA